MLPSVEVQCPYCEALFDLPVDPVAEEQRFTQECASCHRSMLVIVDVDDDGTATATVESEDES